MSPPGARPTGKRPAGAPSQSSAAPAQSSAAPAQSSAAPAQSSGDVRSSGAVRRKKGAGAAGSAGNGSAASTPTGGAASTTRSTGNPEGSGGRGKKGTGSPAATTSSGDTASVAASSGAPGAPGGGDPGAPGGGGPGEHGGAFPAGLGGFDGPGWSAGAGGETSSGVWEPVVRVSGVVVSVAAALVTGVVELLLTTLRAGDLVSVWRGDPIGSGGGPLIGLSVLLAIVGNLGIAWFAVSTTGRRWALGPPWAVWTLLMLFAAGIRTSEGDYLLSGTNYIALAMILIGSLAFALYAYRMILRRIPPPGPTAPGPFN